MKTYPTISKEILRGMSVYAFSKFDGSNIRAEWNRKKGFYKFGSRNRLLGSDQEFQYIPQAEEIIRAQEEEFSAVFKRNGWERIILFFEFWGEYSFAGWHEDEEHRVTLIDANPHKKGILPPKEFVRAFSGFDVAPVLYHGPCDAEFEESVRQNTLEDMPFEGVVCKAKNPKNAAAPIMFKIKNFAWYEKLREFCAGDEKKFEALA